MWTFREVLDRLLGVVCGSVRQALRGERVTPLPALVHNTCLLLAATVAELSAETSTTEVGYVQCLACIKESKILVVLRLLKHSTLTVHIDYCLM